ncbi:tetratricopeptide repeat protein [Tropicimonas sp.]|uniref:tetratricopeptide repeat protein n=1 Tax=Tropicimonas sp. TaxID=2067044 RepID=UPI003A88CE52
MSHEADSFIDEVTDAVRRDRLFATLRKYGWIGILAVVIIVGGASWNEWQKAQRAARASALGDAILAALQNESPAEGAIALQEIPAQGAASSVVNLLVAADELAADDPSAAAATLGAVAGNSELSATLSDLAAFKLVMMGEHGVDADVRAQLLDRLARPGAPYRNLALEQKVVDLAAAGDTEAAVAAARALLQEPGLTQALVNRVSQLIVALGADIAEGAG